MRTTRRDFMKRGAAALAATALRPGQSVAAPAREGPGRPLRVLILGGTGFTGPFQVRYALERGHEITGRLKGR